jgi:hypothetical protein
VACREVLSRHFPEATEKIHEKSSGWPVSGSTFEPGTFLIRIGNSTYLTASPLTTSSETLRVELTSLH